MKAEIISIGTELLLGQITNTNASFLASELHELGISSHFQTTVGDNEKRIHEVLKTSLGRSDILITTGGLGPTPDDLTHEALATFFDATRIVDKKVLTELRAKFKSRGYKKMPTNNEKQAYKPKGAKWINNKLGTANGIFWRVKYFGKEKIILTFPGVPREMKQMWNSSAKKSLGKLSKYTIFSKTLKYTGIGESAIAEKINKYFKQSNPTVAPYASIGEVKIRITAREKSLSAAKSKVLHTSKKIKQKTKKYFYGEDEDTLESVVAKLLISKKLTISAAESCTGGLLTKRLTDISGSSKYLKSSMVTYSNSAKEKLLNVSKASLKKYGAVSHQVAKEMAKGIKEAAGSSIGISITGIAGPTGGSKNKPVGLVYFGLSYKNKVKTKEVLFGSNSTRYSIRLRATQYALNWIREELS